MNSEEGWFLFHSELLIFYGSSAAFCHSIFLTQGFWASLRIPEFYGEIEFPNLGALTTLLECILFRAEPCGMHILVYVFYLASRGPDICLKKNSVS